MRIRKYTSFFRLRFLMGLQYRAAALGGVITQFVWGFMKIMMFRAFYEGSPEAFPMEFSGLASYIWLEQAFIALYAAWFMENEIFDAVLNGNVAYELCRPVRIYHMWFVRSVANRMSMVVLRCVPILAVVIFLPRPYGLTGPAGGFQFLMFGVTLLMSLLVTTAICMIVYILGFYTVSAQGLRIFFLASVEFFAGGLIPLPFFPDGMRKVLELLPFASMQNVPLRIYSGDLWGSQMMEAVMLQAAWLGILLLTGWTMCKKAERKVTVQGG